MIRYSFARIQFLLLLCILLIPLPSRASEDPFFEEHYTKINNNISQEAYSENIVLFADLVSKSAFQQLPCREKGRIFHKIGVTYYLLFEEQKAIPLFRDSVLTLWEDCTAISEMEKANTIYNLGVCYQYIGETEKAKAKLDKALATFENSKDYPPLDLAIKYEGVGNFYVEVYDAFRAELYYNNALNIYKNADQAITEQFDVLNHLIAMNVDFKRYNSAKGYIDRALSLYEAYPENIAEFELSLMYLNAGSVEFELKNYPLAQEYAQKAKAIISKNGEGENYLDIAQELLAMIEAEQGNYPQSLLMLEQVVELRKKNLTNVESYTALTIAYENLCDVYIRDNQISKAEAILMEAFNLISINARYDKDRSPIIAHLISFDDLQLIRLIDLKARIYQKKYEQQKELELLDKASVIHMKIDSLIQQNILALDFENSKLDYFELIYEYYGKAIEQALRLFDLTQEQNYLNRAYYFSSRTKAIILQYERNQNNALKAIAAPDILQRYEDLTNRLYELQELIPSSGSERDTLLRDYTQVQNELDFFWKEIEAKYPEYYQKRYALIEPLAISEIQEKLSDDMVVVEYFHTEKSIFSFWISSDDIFYTVFKNDASFQKSLDTFVSHCNNPETIFSKDTAAKLFDQLLKRGVEQIPDNIHRICIIPDGKLHTVSFEALVQRKGKEDTYLLEDFQVSYSYSSNLLFRKETVSPKETYCGFGTSYSPRLGLKLRVQKRLFGNSDLGQLTLSKDEINKASEIFDGRSFIGSKANLENFRLHSSNARILHLSLHGLVDINDPGRSCIIFDDSRQDFILSALDLYAHNIPSDLVVLSSCHTASGKIYNGEGVQGMSKAFLLSGASNILSSLWSASEASSLHIMTSFLQNVHDGDYHDAAIHHAKLDYLQRVEPHLQHPFYWANFILLGEVDQRFSEAKTFSSYGYWIAAVLILLLFIFFIKKPNA